MSSNQSMHQFKFDMTNEGDCLMYLLSQPKTRTCRRHIFQSVDRHPTAIGCRHPGCRISLKDLTAMAAAQASSANDEHPFALLGRKRIEELHALLKVLILGCEDGYHDLDSFARLCFHVEHDCSRGFRKTKGHLRQWSQRFAQSFPKRKSFALRVLFHFWFKIIS